jgi:glycerol-3-phosphate dehydrogenase (NAD+)
MMSQIIPQALGNPYQPFVLLSGPSFALELMNKLPTGDLSILNDTFAETMCSTINHV